MKVSSAATRRLGLWGNSTNDFNQNVRLLCTQKNMQEHDYLNHTFTSTDINISDSLQQPIETDCAGGPFRISIASRQCEAFRRLDLHPSCQSEGNKERTHKRRPSACKGLLCSKRTTALVRTTFNPVAQQSSMEMGEASVCLVFGLGGFLPLALSR